MRKSRKKRLQNFIIILLLSSAGVLLVLFSLNSKLDLFYSPTEMLLAQPHQESRIKLGGMVKQALSIEWHGYFFVVTDLKAKYQLHFAELPQIYLKKIVGLLP